MITRRHYRLLDRERIRPVARVDCAGRTGAAIKQNVAMHRPLKSGHVRSLRIVCVRERARMQRPLAIRRAVHAAERTAPVGQCAR